MQRVLMIRTYGNQDIAKAVLPTMETVEMKRLREQAEFERIRRERYWRRKIMESKVKYVVRPSSMLADRLWGAVGLIVLLTSGGIRK